MTAETGDIVFYFSSITDGAAGRDDFFVDEILIASDVSGYGTPTGVDANGNAYIDPAIKAGDFA